MKTFRILFTVFVVLFLAVGISHAQDKNVIKTTETYSWPYEGPVPCGNENIVGEESCVVTTWGGIYQCSYKGAYTGSISGKCYSMSAFEILFSYKIGKASSKTFFFKSVLKREGVPIAMGNFKSHITINANGEVMVEMEEGIYWGWICL